MTDFVEVGNGISLPVVETYEQSMLKIIQDETAEDFPEFCQRACRVCNGKAVDILQECPVVKWDTFVFLKRTKGRAAAAIEFRDVMGQTIDEELISAVNLQKALVKKHQSRHFKRDRAS